MSLHDPVRTWVARGKHREWLFGAATLAMCVVIGRALLTHDWVPFSALLFCAVSAMRVTLLLHSMTGQPWRLPAALTATGALLLAATYLVSQDGLQLALALVGSLLLFVGAALGWRNKHHSAAHIGISILLAATTSELAHAQRPLHGDTLRYVQSITAIGQVGVRGELDPEAIYLQARANIWVAFTAPNVAVTWYDPLTTLSATTSQLSSAWDQLRGQRVTLRVASDGLVQPADAAVAALLVNAHLLSPGGSFWLTGKPSLRPGSVWTDSITIPDVRPGGIGLTVVSHYDVVGDSTFEGIPILILRTRIAQAGTSGAGRALTTWHSQGSGRAFYAPRLGVLVWHAFNAHLEMNIHIEGETLIQMTCLETVLRLESKTR